jgi:hypothetical protein
MLLGIELYIDPRLALKGRCSKAQGAALGCDEPSHRALKGRNWIVPWLSYSIAYLCVTIWACAPDYYLSAPLGLGRRILQPHFATENSYFPLPDGPT